MRVFDYLTDHSLLQSKSFINGVWIDAQQQKTFPVINPATLEIITQVADLGVTETELAITAAEHAWLKWRDLLANQRQQILYRWAQLIRAQQEDLAILLTLENGKPIAEARAEIIYGVNFIEWYAEQARRVLGSVIPTISSDRRLITIKQPIGVAALITPWNFPFSMITRKCAPALAAGCSVIIKPAEDTPLSALALAVLAERAGVPAGVLNVITTHDPIPVAQTLCASTRVRKLSFTGSVAVGKILMQQSAATVKKLSLELGNNAPFIVFNDADINAAVTGAMAAKFRNSGQTCVCVNRFLIHDDIYDQFVASLVSAVKQLVVGNGLTEGTMQGPLINQQSLLKVQRHVADAISKGAKLLVGGEQHALGKTFFQHRFPQGFNRHIHP